VAAENKANEREGWGEYIQSWRDEKAAQAEEARLAHEAKLAAEAEAARRPRSNASWPRCSKPTRWRSWRIGGRTLRRCWQSRARPEPTPRARRRPTPHRPCATGYVGGAVKQFLRRYWGLAVLALLLFAWTSDTGPGALLVMSGVVTFWAAFQARPGAEP
jgi:hypothetical protein